jgi:hypothetical protein
LYPSVPVKMIAVVVWELIDVVSTDEGVDSVSSVEMAVDVWVTPVEAGVGIKVGSSCSVVPVVADVVPSYIDYN